jgi:hypothetical protein
VGGASHGGSVKAEVLLVKALVDGEEDEVLVFRVSSRAVHFTLLYFTLLYLNLLYFTLLVVHLWFT